MRAGGVKMCEETNINVNEIDILGRGEFVNNCRLLINTIFETTKSSFIMIDGEWGVGKTFVMNMLDKDLKDEYTVIKYNCWENSYYADPLEAILSMMLDYIERDKLWTNEDKEKIKLLLNSIVFMLSLGTFKIKSEYKDNFKELKQSIKDGIPLNQSINIHSAINEVKQFLKFNNEKIVILVDEIDRCLPDYAIKTLERLYLLFKNMPNIVVIIANDKNKLEMIIKNVFGYDSINNYLEKFIDYFLILKQIDINYNKIKLLQKKYICYFSKFNLNSSYQQFLICAFANMSIRNIDKIMNKVYKMHILCFESNKIYNDFVLLVELAAVLFANKLKKFSLENIMSYLKNNEKKAQLYKYFSIVNTNRNTHFNSLDKISDNDLNALYQSKSLEEVYSEHNIDYFPSSLTYDQIYLEYFEFSKVTTFLKGFDEDFFYFQFFFIYLDSSNYPKPDVNSKVFYCEKINEIIRLNKLISICKFLE